MAVRSGKLTKKLVENLGPGRHGDGAGLYLVVDPSGARRWIVRVTIKGQRNRNGGPLRTDLGLGGADVVTLHQARERALEYRRMAKSGLNPRLSAQREVPSLAGLSRQVDVERMPTWEGANHGQKWLNTLPDYAFPKIGCMPEGGMCEVRETVPIDGPEGNWPEMFRVALSEPDHDARLCAIRAVRHEVAFYSLRELFSSRCYTECVSSSDYNFLKWAAETAMIRHEAMLQFAEVANRYESSNERRLNVAEEIGFTIFESVKDEKFRGVHTPGGILEQVREKSQKEKVHGGKDIDTLRTVWKTYCGVVHLGMAITYLEEHSVQHFHFLQLAEFFRELLSTSCPKSTKAPYVLASKQIKFLYLSSLKGPRFQDRGLPFFNG